MERKETNNNIDELIQIVTNYLKTYLDLLSIRLVDKLSLLLSKFVYLGLILFFFLLTIVFTFIALGLYLGELLDSYSLGFLSLAGLSILFIIYYVFKPARGRGIYKLLIRFFSIVADNHDESSKP
jgi:hypothetical protein